MFYKVILRTMPFFNIKFYPIRFLCFWIGKFATISVLSNTTVQSCKKEVLRGEVIFSDLQISGFHYQST